MTAPEGAAARPDAGVVLAAGVVTVLVLVAAAAPAITPHDPTSGALSEALQGPSTEHWLGTDHLGRDELSRLLHGARISLLAALEALSIGIVVGIPVGLLAGYRGGRLDRFVMRVVEVAVSLPTIVLAIALAAAIGPGLRTSMLAVGLLAATVLARLTRTLVLAARAEGYVDGARASGASELRILGRHVVPNIAPALAVQVTLLFSAAILAEATLSFLGLGAVPPDPSWGIMLDQARDHVDVAPLLAVWPGACIFLTVLAVNRLGDDTQGTRTRRRGSALDARAVGPIGRAGNGDATGADAALELRDLTVTFPAPGGAVAVVDDVSLRVGRGEVVALVGPSGAGKSTLALAALGLVPPPGRTSARSITVDGAQLVGTRDERLRDVRGARIGYVGQAPARSLHPMLTVGHQLAEPLRWHLLHGRRQARAEANALLRRVGIDPTRIDAYPHELSGGEAQRVAIAMAVACRPTVLVADEPTSALDVVNAAAVLDLLLDLRAELGMAMLLISHDLGAVGRVADRVAVMDAGRLVVVQERAAMFERPEHEAAASMLGAARRLYAVPDGTTALTGSRGAAS